MNKQPFRLGTGRGWAFRTLLSLLSHTKIHGTHKWTRMCINVINIFETTVWTCTNYIEAPTCSNHLQSNPVSDHVCLTCVWAALSASRLKGLFETMDSNSMTPPLTSFLCAWHNAEGMNDLVALNLLIYSRFETMWCTSWHDWNVLC